MKQANPGPPNYDESSPAETHLFLDLPMAICVDADPKNPDLNVAESGVKRVQVAGEPAERGFQLVGQRASITGTLFHRSTGHHHTDVLIFSEKIEVPLK